MAPADRCEVSVSISGEAAWHKRNHSLRFIQPAIKLTPKELSKPETILNEWVGRLQLASFFWCHMLYRQRQMRWVLVYICIRAKPLLSGFKRTVSIIVSDNFLMGNCLDCAAERFLNGHKAKEDKHSLSVTEGSLAYLCAEWTTPKHYPVELWDAQQNRPRIFIAACI